MLLHWNLTSFQEFAMNLDRINSLRLYTVTDLSMLDFELSERDEQRKYRQTKNVVIAKSKLKFCEHLKMMSAPRKSMGRERETDHVSNEKK